MSDKKVLPGFVKDLEAAALRSPVARLLDVRASVDRRVRFIAEIDLDKKGLDRVRLARVRHFPALPVTPIRAALTRVLQNVAVDLECESAAGCPDDDPCVYCALRDSLTVPEAAWPKAPQIQPPDSKG